MSETSGERGLPPQPKKEKPNAWTSAEMEKTSEALQALVDASDEGKMSKESYGQLIELLSAIKQSPDAPPQIQEEAEALMRKLDASVTKEGTQVAVPLNPLFSFIDMLQNSAVRMQPEWNPYGPNV